MPATDQKRWERLKELLEEVLLQPGEARPEFLRQQCADDPLLLQEAESLLAHNEAAGSFLEGNPLEVYGSGSAGQERFIFTAGELLCGRFEIVRFIGRGGMGEVYEARDRELGGHIALKTLRAEILSDRRAVERFRQEIQLARRIAHPNVCRMFEVGWHREPSDEASTDRMFFTMELLCGGSLAQAMHGRKPMSLEEAAPLLRQMAEALHAAHTAGVIHRDFKPSNVVLESGERGSEISRVVVTDFGLALAAMRSPGEQQSFIQSLTVTGQLLGTLAYMSPEQLQGAEATPASDVYSLGLVAYEMLTGRKPFAGDAPLAGAFRRLMQEPPPARTLVANLDSRCDEILQRCLRCDPAQRFQSAAEVAGSFVALQKKRFAFSPARIKAASGAVTWHLLGRRSALRKPWLGWGTAGVLLAVLAAVTVATYLRERPAPVVRAVVPMPSDLIPDDMTETAGDPVLSPDGSKIVFAAHQQGRPQLLWVRALSSNTPTPLTGTDGATSPFWSPDSRWIGFFAAGKMSRISAEGGPVITLADAPQGRGASWGESGLILYAPEVEGEIWRTDANGRAPERVTKLDHALHTTHRWPCLLPDGKHFLYLATNDNGGKWEQNGIYLASLDGPENRLVLPTDGAAEYASGYLLYRSQSSLMAQQFELRTLAVSGQPFTLAEGLWNNVDLLHGIFSTSASGALIYELGDSSLWGKRDLVWYDRSGAVQGHFGGTDNYKEISISPKGDRVAVVIGNTTSQIWIANPVGTKRSRLSFHESPDFAPAWSSDGTTIFYHSTKIPITASNGMWPAYLLKSRFVDGHGPERVLADSSIESASYLVPKPSPDGQLLVFRRYGARNATSLVAKRIAGDQKLFTIVPAPTPPAEIGAYAISNDGKWLAYASNESGDWAVYVVSFPSGSGKWQVSAQPATSPFWRHDSKELFFIGSRDLAMYAASIDSVSAAFSASAPKRLFTLPSAGGVRMSDEPCDTSDGQRFLCLANPPDPRPALNLVLNWANGLQK